MAAYPLVVLGVPRTCEPTHPPHEYLWRTPVPQMASLSAEACEGGAFICTAFDVDDEGMDAFREREAS